MTDSKHNEGLEEQDFSSFYRIDVYRQNRYYAMFDADDTDDQEFIPFSGADDFSVEKAYSVYTLDQTQVFERLKEAVEKEEGIYRVRVYHFPLNSTILNEECSDLTVFDSKGEIVSNSEHERFNAGEIVEFHDLKEDMVRLAVVYDAPKSKEDSERSEDSGNCLYDQDKKYYKLLTEGSIWSSIPVSCVSRPSFPVSDAFKEKLEGLYKQKVEDVKNGNLSFTDLLDLL